MSPTDKQDIIDSLIAALQAQPVTVLEIDHPEQHADDHRFVQMLIARERKRAKRWESVRQQVTGWSIVILLGAVGTSVYQAMIHTLRNGGGQ